MIYNPEEHELIVRFEAESKIITLDTENFNLKRTLFENENIIVGNICLAFPLLFI